MEGKVILLVVIGTISVMLMAFSVVYFVLLYRRKTLESQLEIQQVKTKHQEEMLNATLKSQEAERNRLGTELHDSVGAMLSSIKLNLQVTQRKDGIKSLDSVLGHMDETIGLVRSISHQMMPIILKKYGLKRAVEDLFEKTSNEELAIQILEWVDPKLNEEDSLMLYRIIQELMNNSIKHASAKNIFLSLKEHHENTIKISYLDDGVGFPSEVLENAKGMGLLNIKNRAQVINADVKFMNNNEGGAEVNLVLDAHID